MENIPAACAMDWSIELEKSLRSQKPGASVEGILKIGPRLEQWSTDPQPSKAAYKLFGLVPGEDNLFANTILLRLADTFRLGDIHIKHCVVKIFLSELRHRRKKKRSNNGILSKSRVDNPLELLTRVKVVFDNGDVESRSYSLILFGCWADFAKENADIRYLILSSLVSSHGLEVKASLFAAGCFCELSDDFAHVVLEILTDIVTSSKTLPAIRLAGVRGFVKLGCSSPLANRAYKVGTKLVLESSEEDFLVSMLISLSILASRSALLIPEQVELLLSYMQETTLRVQATALRCLQIIYARGLCHFVFCEHTVKTLFCLLDEPQLSSTMQCEALWILHEILLYKLHNLLCTDVLKLNLSKLLRILENASRSPFMSNKLLAMRILVNMSAKLRGQTELEWGGACSTSLPSRVISLIIDQLTLLVKQVPNYGQRQVDWEAQSLLNLLLGLVEEHPDLCVVVLDNMYSFIEDMVALHERVMPTVQSCSLSKGQIRTSIRSKLTFYVYRFLVVFLDILEEVGAISMEIIQKVKILVRYVHQCQCHLFDCYTLTLYSLLLHSYSTGHCIENRETYKLDRNLDTNYLGDLEKLSLANAKEMLSQKDNWSAYKAGIYAACQGAWLTAAFIFEQLLTKVQSDSCYCWLNSLARFAHSEREIQHLLLPRMSPILVVNSISTMPSRDDLGKTVQEAASNIDLLDYSEKLFRAYSSVCSSRETLEANVTSGEAFYFQKWFLTLRVEVLKTVLNILEILRTFSSNQDSISNERWFQHIRSLVDSLTQISHRLMRLVRSFDLMSTSFIGIDSKSLEVISALAVSCSILAFCSGFALSIPDIPAYERLIAPSLEKPEKSSHVMLIQNLIVRLGHIDHETCTNLKLILKLTGEPKGCFQLLSRNQILSSSCKARDILKVCSDAVAGVINIQNEAHIVPKEEMLSRVTKGGLLLLSDIIKKWMDIPFRVPKSFFRLRPCIGSELFAISTDIQNPGSIAVLPGFHLSLSLCLQLKNWPSDLPIRLTKLYGILNCSTSFQIPSSSGEKKGQASFGSQAWETEDVMDLNIKLKQYATEGTKRLNAKHCMDTDKNGGTVKTFLCFEQNERGQGFSTCLLDVSSFPAGSYRIKWLSCCIDDQGQYWSFLPLNDGPVFTVQKSPVFKSPN